MTQDVSGDLPDDYFSLSVRDTVEVGDGSYLQSAYSSRSDSFSILFRESGRYGSPVELTSGLGSEEDALQLLSAAEENGFKELRTVLQK